MGIPADHAHLGDPEGMESLASELMLRAETIAGIATSLARQVERMTFVGPAADQLRDEMEVRRRRAERMAGDLQGAAHSLKRSAATVREQLHEIRSAGSQASREGPE